MAEPDAPKPSEGKGRSLGRGGRVLLYISLLANFAVVGLVIGALLSGGDRGHDRRPPRTGESGLGPLVQALNVEDRRDMGREMRRALRDAGRSRAELRALGDEMVATLRADPFEIAAFEGLLDAQFSEVGLRLELAKSVFVERLAAMNATERAAFAERLEGELSKPRDTRGFGNGRPAN